MTYFISVSLLFVSALLSFHLRIYLHSKTKDSRSGRVMSWMMAATSFWAFFNGVEFLAPSLELKLLAANLQYISIAGLPILWYSLGNRLFKQDDDTRISLFQRETLVWIVPVITALLVWTDPWLGLVRGEFGLGYRSGLLTLTKSFGPWFWFHMAYSYLFILMGTVKVIRALARHRRSGLSQALVLISAALVPTLANALYLFNLWPLPAVDPTPIAFSVTGLLFVLTFSRFRFLALLPAAQEAVIATMDDGILMVDKANRLVYLNKAARTQLKVSRLESGRKIDDLAHDFPSLTHLPPLPDPVENPQQMVSSEIHLPVREGVTHYEVRGSWILEGKSPIAGVYTFHDITQRVQAKEILEKEIAVRTAELREELDRRTASERQLFFYSLHDPLTKLPNRSLLMNRLEMTYQRFRRAPDQPFALLYFDVDNFKQLNDSYGHEAGDHLLKEMATRLVAGVRTVDTVSRLGGDEFVVLLDRINNDLEALEVADRLSEDLSMPLTYGGKSLLPSVSVGILPSSLDYIHPDELLRDADLAMYHAKNAGKNRRVVFEQAMRQAFLERTKLTGDLKQAILKGELELHYQPVIRLSDRTVVGCEALVRWNHPELGRLSPDRFIPLAEESGLIVPLGLAVFIEACQTAFKMKETFPDRQFYIAVNVSALQLGQSDFAEVLASTVSRHGLKPSALHLEITESALVERTDAVMPVLRALQEKGFSFKLDDFGTGYSSLAYLHKFPIQTIKIDRSFILDLDGTPEAGAGENTEGILKGIISLGHELKKDIIAEGIETLDQAHRLGTWTCDYAQGYFFGKPMPREQWMKYLEDFSLNGLKS